MGSSNKRLKRCFWQLVLIWAFGLIPQFHTEHSFVHAQELLPSGQVVYFGHKADDGSLAGGKTTLPSMEGDLMFSVEADEDLPSATTVINNGRPQNRVDFAVLGDGYTQNQLGLYSSDVANLTNQIFTESPFYEYQQYFNVHKVDTISAESGVENDAFLGDQKDTALNMTFWCHDEQGTLCVDVATTLRLAEAAAGSDQIIAIGNSGRFGGAAYPFSDLSLVSARDAESGDHLVHQIGHAFANLADEHSSGKWPTYTGYEPAEPNVSALTSTEMTSQELKWYRWLGAETTLGTIGSHAGAMGFEQSIYRPTLTSKMRELAQPFNAPSVEAILIEIYRFVDPIDDATPNGQLTGQDTLWVTPMQPLNHQLTVRWYLNNTLINGATSNTLRLDDYPLYDGTYEVKVVVSDETDLVRNEAARDEYMTSSRTWNVVVDQFKPVFSLAPQNQTVNVGETATFSVEAIGGGVSYQWLKNGVPIPGATGASYTTPAALHENDQDRYSVDATNLYGTTRSSDATLTVLNKAPLLGAISDKSMHWRVDSINVELSSSDGDSDPISYSSRLADGSSAPVSFSIENSTLTINPNAGYVGVFRVRVEATDGYDVAAREFQVDVYNSTPTIGALGLRRLHYKQTELRIPLTVNDADSDPYTLNAEVTSHPGSAPLVSFEGETFVFRTTNSTLGRYIVRITANDTKSVGEVFAVIDVYNTAPVLEEIEPQSANWRSTSHTVNLSCSDEDGDNLTYSAALTTPVDGVSVTLNGSQLVISRPAKLNSALHIAVTCSDGLADSIQTFSFTSFNRQPEISQISEQIIHWNEDSRNVVISATDPDGDEIVYTFEVVPYMQPWEEETSYDARQNDQSWYYDLTGNNELLYWGTDGTTGEPKWQAILPDGQVHRWSGKIDPTLESYPVVQFPKGIHHDPTLLTQANGPQIPVPVALSTNNNVVTINPDNSYRGVFKVIVYADDYPLDSHKGAASEFLVSVVDSVPTMQRVGRQRIHWTQTQHSLELSAIDADSNPRNDDLEYNVNIVPQNNLYQLDQLYNFHPYSEDNYNFEGHDEKYIVSQTVDAPWLTILKFGEVLEYKGSIAQSSFLMNLPSPVWEDPNILIDVPPVAEENPVSATLSGTSLNLTYGLGYTGTTLIRSSVTDNERVDSEVFALEVYNNAPELDEISGRHFGRFEYGLVINASSEDADPEDSLTYRAWVGDYSDKVRQLNAEYQFQAHSQGWQFNRYGLREKHFLAHENNFPFEAVILPSGQIWRWNGTLASSVLVDRVDSYFYGAPDQEAANLALFDDNAPRNYPNITVSVEGGRILVQRNDDDYRGFVLTVEVSDGNLYDSQYVGFASGNRFPLLDEIEDQLIHWTQDTHKVTVSATDDDNDPLTYSAVLFDRSAAYDLDQQHNFFEPANGYLRNIEGKNEIYFQGREKDASHDSWYFLLTNGELYKYYASIAQSTFIRTLPAIYHQNPELLFDVPQPESIAPASVSIDGREITIDPVLGYTGTFPIYVTVSDGVLTNSRVFYTTVYNNKPVLDEIGPQYASWKADSASLTLTASDIDEETLTYSGRVGTYAHLAYELDQVHHFALLTEDFVTNPYARRGKFFQGRLNGIDTTYSILPSGELYLWDGNGYSSSQLLGRLSEEYYNEPRMLFSAPNPGALPSVIVSVNDNTMRFDYPDGFVGTFPVIAAVTDGLDYDHEVFNLTVGNSGPALDEIPNQSMHWRTDSLSVSLSATEPDGETITYTAQVVDNPSPATVSISDNVVTINPQDQYTGTFTVNVTASDGLNTTARQFTVTVYNNAPELQSIGTQSIGYKAGNLSLSLFASDADSDPLTYSANLIGSSSSNATLSLVSNQLTVTPKSGYTGALTVYVEVNDGLESDVETFVINVTNSAPVISGIANQRMTWRERSRTVNFSVSDVDNDQLTLGISSSRQEGSVRIENNSIAIDVAERFVGSFNVTLTASDGSNPVSATFRVDVVNNAPIIQAIKTQRVIWNNGEHQVTLSASDPEDDPLTFSARVVSTDSSLAQLRIAGGKLYITPRYAQANNFSVEVSVTDSLLTSTTTFAVLLANDAPTVGLIEDVHLHWRTKSHTVYVPIEDRNNHPTSISARIATNTGFPARVSTNEKTIRVEILEDRLGNFEVEVEADDGNLQSTRRFAVYVENNAPTIAPIEDQELSLTTTSLSKTLDGNDLDNDPLTYFGKALSMEEFLFELDQTHNFFQTNPNHDFDRLNNLEKYIGGDKNQTGARHTYVIYPSGKFYEWKNNKLSDSIYLGLLPVAFYDDPTLLFDVAEPTTHAEAHISLDGNVLTVRHDYEVSSFFYVQAGVNDGIEDAKTYFRVLVRATGGGGGTTPPGGGNQCKIETINHEGEFSGPEVSTNFVAEGRIGDSATGAGNRTFEVDVSESTSGPFENGETSNYLWRNGQETPFTLTFDATSGVVEFVVDGTTVGHQTNVTESLTDILIRTKARLDTASIEINNLKLNGSVVDASVKASLVDGDVNVLQVFGGSLENGFVLEGTATMRWANDYGVDIVENGSFEYPNLNGGWNIFTSEEVPGWNVEWLEDSPCPEDSRVSQAVMELQTDTSASPNSGSQLLELDSDCHGPEANLNGGEYTTTSVSQELSTVPGAYYQLSFYARKRPGNHGAQLLSVSWDGLDLLTDAEPGSDWNKYSYRVRASQETTSLVFEDTGEANSFGVLLDDVKVIGQTNAQPPTDSGLAFQISMTNVDGHEPCDDGEDDGKVSVCHVPPGNPENAHTIRISRSALKAHLKHGDEVGFCPGDVPTPGDPNDPGEGTMCYALKSITSPTYTLWNSFLSMINILELVNPSTQDITVKLSMYSIHGELAHQRSIFVPAQNQFDVIVNDLPGFVNNSYGIVKLEFEGVLDGRMVYYRYNSDMTGYDFVFGFPLDDPAFGTTALSFNTFQPSFKDDERENLVANWLNIVNLEDSTQRFTVYTYNQSGTLLQRRTVDIPSFGRVDIDGGHDIAGPNVVGSHVIVPDNISTRYIAHLTRFGGNTKAGFAPSSYKFAFPLVAQYPSSDPVFTDVSNKYGEFNWVEVINVRDEWVYAAVNLYTSSGELRESIDTMLAPHAQQHINAQSFLLPGETGYVEIIPSTPRSIIAQSMVYFRDSTTGSVTSIYGSQARKAYQCTQAGSFNLFLSMENWLKVSNTSNEPIETTIVLNGPSHSAEKRITIPARGSIDVPIHDPSLFGAQADTYGLVTIRGDDTRSLYAQMIRLRFISGGLVDFGVPLPVR